MASNRSRFLRVEMEGVEPLLERLRQVAPKLEKRELKKAVGKAAQFGLKIARQKTPWGRGVGKEGRPRKHLRDTLAKKVKQYKKSAVGIIGPKYREAPHSHLVHDGTRPHTIRLPEGKAFRLNGGPLMVGFMAFRNPGAKPQPFIKEAWEQSKSPCAGAIIRSLKDFFKAPDL